MGWKEEVRARSLAKMESDREWARALGKTYRQWQIRVDGARFAAKDDVIEWMTISEREMMSQMLPSTFWHNFGEGWAGR